MAAACAVFGTPLETGTRAKHLCPSSEIQVLPQMCYLYLLIWPPHKGETGPPVTATRPRSGPPLGGRSEGWVGRLGPPGGPGGPAEFWPSFQEACDPLCVYMLVCTRVCLCPHLLCERVCAHPCSHALREARVGAGGPCACPAFSGWGRTRATPPVGRTPVPTHHLRSHAAQLGLLAARLDRGKQSR